jgi:hypothetical protein
MKTGFYSLNIFLLFFLLLSICFYSCNPYWCCIKYVTASDESTIEDSVISFSCSGFRGWDRTGINLSFDIESKEKIDSFDIRVITDKNDSLNIMRVDVSGMNPKYKKFDSIYVNGLIVPKSEKKSDYWVRFGYNEHKIIESKFIIIKLRTTINKDNEKIKYRKEVKLFPTKDCVSD